MDLQRGIRLRIEEPGLRPRLLASDASLLVIGRDPECDVVLEDDLVSRRHARLELLTDGRIALVDLGSSNGTYVDDRRVTTTVWLDPPSQVRVGHTVVTVEARMPRRPVAPPVGVPPERTPTLVESISPVPPPQPRVGPPPAPPIVNRVLPVVPPRPQVPDGWGSASHPAARPGRPGPAVIGIVGLVAVVILGAAFAVATGFPGKTGSASSGPSGASAGSTPVASSLTASGAPPGASSGPATSFEFETSVTGATTTSTLTTNQTACNRDPAKARSLQVDFTTSGPAGTTVSLADDDTSADPAILSKLDIVVGLSEPLHDVVVSLSDITNLEVHDSGDHASISLSATTAGGDGLTGTITCNRIGP